MAGRARVSAEGGGRDEYSYSMDVSDCDQYSFFRLGRDESSK